jgi:ABC-type oligopeptide transport system substrate-binding subunit
MLKRKIILFALSITFLTFLINRLGTKDNMFTIKIAYYYNESALGLDPANIQTIYQANLIENIYSRLLEYNSEGQLECVLCNRFWT